MVTLLMIPLYILLMCDYSSQGAYHNLMRWVNRSSFQLRPVRGQQPGVANRIPIPKTDSLFVDPGWHGTIVVETEGRGRCETAR
jgi:hypothetical protein